MHRHLKLSILVLTASVILAGCSTRKKVEAAFDNGYVVGQSDAIKRQYWLRQAMEKEKSADKDAGEPVYYAVPGPEETADGKKLAPHTVVVPVVE